MLPSVQSAFRKNYSTSTALIKITTDITKNMDEGRMTYLCLLDYSKAFDTIDRQLLRAKLGYYGVVGSALGLFSNYLSDRSQMVKIGSTISSEIKSYCGVPQGSVLGPLLYCIYIADFPEILTNGSKVHCYADDVQFYKSGRPEDSDRLVSELNWNLDIISEWSRNNGLRLNSSKTQILRLEAGSRFRGAGIGNESIKLNGEDIRPSECIKSLGVVLDRFLRFKEHANGKLRVAWWKLLSLWKFKNIMSSDVKWKLVNSLVLCHLDYANTVYYTFLSQGMKDKLQVLQNTCLRYAYLIGRRVGPKICVAYLYIFI